jgi:CheY-like chemotaxis protein
MSEAASGRPRVLVLEDELLIALDLGSLLTTLGCEVVGPVGRLAEALALAEREPLDAAILDVQLRDAELSYPVADRLMAHAVPVAFCTAYDDNSIDPAYAVCPRLHKPFAQADVAALLDRLLAAAQRPRRGGGGKGSLSS